MRRAMLVLAIVGFMAAPTLAAVGESWILPIDHRDGGGWTELPGAGYNGTSAWEASGMDGVRRVYWSLSGIGSMGNPVPSTTEQYTIEWFAPTTGAQDWQPIESQIKGVDGETFPMEPLIPWAGAYGTNHQYIGTNGAPGGTWATTGPGPHTPESADYNAGPNGIYMWLGGWQSASWLYAKWDYPWSIDHAWSAIKLTQVTPEPISMLLFGLGGLAMLRRKPRV
jgi:hypothetical protein